MVSAKLHKPWKVFFINPAFGKPKSFPGCPPLAALDSPVKYSENHWESTFSGGGGGATRSRKRIHLGVAGKSYGFRKIMENHWKNNIFRDLALAANRDFLPAMTLPRMKKGLQQMKNLSFLGYQVWIASIFARPRAKPIRARTQHRGCQKKKKTAISLPTDGQT